jgi:hypothetical protein
MTPPPGIAMLAVMPYSVRLISPVAEKPALVLRAHGVGR